MVIKEDRNGWHVIVKMPNGECIAATSRRDHVTRYKLFLISSVHMYLWEYSNF